MEYQGWCLLTGRCLAIALLLAVVSVDQGQAASSLARSKRQTEAQEECVAACEEKCGDYTFDCWYGICTGCRWMCPYTCRLGITEAGEEEEEEEEGEEGALAERKVSSHVMLLALVLLTACVHSGQTRTLGSRARRQADFDQAACESDCKQRCQANTLGCVYNLCTPCYLSCPLSCSFTAYWSGQAGGSNTGQAQTLTGPAAVTATEPPATQTASQPDTQDAAPAQQDKKKNRKRRRKNKNKQNRKKG
ncbi:hypothetical protein EGW08_003342 [Elysia chlorotica]|uniref:4Fe-4S ferredoxin-type domain-containing protein n=1 Tax=Elysia chlorotica TaxID=188477 RepID=A0A433U538_ELYCH|nr:hypothetical protein EGW08_003342 [Elysia chlorotica]